MCGDAKRVSRRHESAIVNHGQVAIRAPYPPKISELPQPAVVAAGGPSGGAAGEQAAAATKQRAALVAAGTTAIVRVLKLDIISKVCAVRVACGGTGRTSACT